MPLKSKISDEEIRKYINEGKSNAQIAKALETSQPNINARCNKFRKQHEPIPEPDPPKEKPVINPDDYVILKINEEPKVDTKSEKSFPFEQNEQVIYSGRLHTVNSVGESRIILRENMSLRPVTITLDEYINGRAIILRPNEKPKIKTVGEAIAQKHHREDEEQEIIISDDEFDAKVEEVHELAMEARKLLSQEAALTIPMDCSFKQIDEVVKESKSVECLFQPFNEVRQDEVAIIENSDKANPLNLNLEMDSITDPVEAMLPLEDNDDYTDPEWFDKPIPKEGTIERRILDKAQREIDEIRALRSAILSALNCGDRLPNTYVDLYNKYVSKYQEAGA